MDSPASIARGRGRASARKRHSFPVGSSHSSSSTLAGAEHVEQPPSLTTPDGVVSPSLSFETPSPTASRGMRARVRVAEGTLPSSEDPDNKGGRSLRKRARVDYTFDHADEYMSDGGKTMPSSARALKRRRTDALFHEVDDEEQYSNPHMKRRSSEQLPPLSSTLRKRNQARKSTLEPQALIPDQQMEDVEVQDTIEVGGHQSEQSDESTLKRTSSNTSSGASHESSKPPRTVGSFDSFLTPQKSHPDFRQADLNKNELQGDAKQPKSAQAFLPDAPESLPDKSPRPSYEHLTPYVEGVFVEWPLIQPGAELASGSQPLHHDATEETAEYQADGAHLDSFKADTVEENTPMPDSMIPDSTPVEGAVEDTPVLSPLPIDTRANSPVGDIALPYNQPPTKKPIHFKKTRDASEFTSLFADYKSLTPEEVWTRLEVVNQALVAWQAEYNDLRKITDDEDNAVRYRQDEVSFLQRLKMVKSKDPNADPLRKDFIVKGIRAERPDPEIAYVRQQDKLMATNYHFDYDEKETKIGYQDPVEQKTGYGKSRLRDRPKQTAKAAEADDVVTGPGKRVRKPVILYDGGEAASRGSSPIPPQRRRRRAGNATEDNGEASLETALPSADTPVEQAPPKKKGKGGRPRKHPLPVPIVEDTHAPSELALPQATQAEEEKPTRKRRRRKAVVEPADQEDETGTNGVDQQAQVKAESRRISSRLPEIPSNSFYTSSMQSTNAADESRPPTSSSTTTQSTVASKNNSNYQLREKRQKKFSLNPDDEVYDEEPKPKRVRRSKKAHIVDARATAAPAAIVSSPPPVQQQQVPEPQPAPKPPTKIKLKNYNGHVSAPLPIPVPAANPFSVPSSSGSTPPHSSHGISNGALNNPDPADIKDYNQMTKSEKMSHSMKARWASGSMSQAVAKRRATLANKKQAVKTEPGQPIEIAAILSQP
ncbi:hypothetical protein F5Y14DRAFT_391353 [Nemania sp. NC0429]|nr:hypothetical protein F5Y14DRAFT_391353 [Nemania sp. NC0429]